MKVYLTNLLPRLQQFSDTLDHKEILVDQPWVLIDDDLNKVQYIFRRNGSLIMSLNGNAAIGRWEYIAAAKSLLVDAGGKKLLLNHGFVNKGVLALKKDGFLDIPWILVNERLVPDLDVEKYLNTFLREKLNIKSVVMDNDTVFDFPDPNSLGLQVGVEVTANGLKANDGIYKSKTGIFHYVVKNGKIISIYSHVIYGTNQGMLLIHKLPYCDLLGCNAYFNNNPAPDGVYQIGSNEDRIKSITIKNEKVLSVRRKKDFAFLILTGIVGLVIGLIVIIVDSKTFPKTSGVGSVSDTKETDSPLPYVDTAARSVSNFEIMSKIENFLDAANQNNFVHAEQYLSPVVERYYNLSGIRDFEVMHEIKRYRQEVVSDPITTYDLSLMTVVRNGENYIVTLPLKEESILRKNNLPYIYETNNEFRLDKNLGIYSITGSVISKRLNSNRLLQIDSSTGFTSDFFGNVFAQLQSPHLPLENKMAIKTALLDLLSPNILIKTDFVTPENGFFPSWYLPDFCDGLIHETIQLNYITNILRSGTEIYQIEVDAIRVTAGRNPIDPS